MGHIGKNKSILSTSVDDELAQEIEQRAAAVGKTKGAYLRDLLLQWYERGAPPVGALDELVHKQAQPISRFVSNNLILDWGDLIF